MPSEALSGNDSDGDLKRDRDESWVSVDVSADRVSRKLCDGVEKIEALCVTIGDTENEELADRVWVLVAVACDREAEIEVALLIVAEEE